MKQTLPLEEQIRKANRRMLINNVAGSCSFKLGAIIAAAATVFAPVVDSPYMIFGVIGGLYLILLGAFLLSRKQDLQSELHILEAEQAFQASKSHVAT